MRPAAYLVVVITVLFGSCTQAVNESTAAPAKPAREPENPAEKHIKDCVALRTNAVKMDSVILRQTETNGKLAGDVIRAFTDFAYHCSTDSLAPIFLIKTAQVAQAVNNTPQAKIVLEKCINDYPNFKNRPAAIFLLAQLYDEAIYLNNEEQARVLYVKIIEEYPKSEWAASAKAALNFIGKSDQQIMEELKKKNKK